MLYKIIILSLFSLNVYASKIYVENCFKDTAANNLGCEIAKACTLGNNKASCSTFIPEQRVQYGSSEPVEHIAVDSANLSDAIYRFKRVDKLLPALTIDPNDILSYDYCLPRGTGVENRRLECILLRGCALKGVKGSKLCINIAHQGLVEQGYSAEEAENLFQVSMDNFIHDSNVIINRDKPDGRD